MRAIRPAPPAGADGAPGENETAGGSAFKKDNGPAIPMGSVPSRSPSRENRIDRFPESGMILE
jgi:hypothetical protein